MEIAIARCQVIRLKKQSGLFVLRQLIIRHVLILVIMMFGILISRIGCHYLNHQKNNKMLEELFTEQRTEEWYAQRLGKFTASRFGDLMTNSRKKDEVLGATAVSYIYEKAAELLTGERKEIFGAALDWGTENEPICKAYFQETTGLTIEEMPFVSINDYSGASPDGFIGVLWTRGDSGIECIQGTAKLTIASADVLTLNTTPIEIVAAPGAGYATKEYGELIEIKCPYNTSNHLKTAFEGYIDPKYMWQMQGQMLATGASVCRFVSFDPRIKDERFKLIEIRVEQDLEMQEQLRERLEFANDYLSNLINQK